MTIYYCTQPIGTLNLIKQTCGVVDIAKAMPTTPQDPTTHDDSKRI